MRRPDRLAIFIDGWNFKYATYDAFGLRVDFGKLLDYLSREASLLRAYYYTGEWDDGGINAYINMTAPDNPEEVRRQLIADRDGQRNFLRYLDRNGYRVRRKATRIFRTADGQVERKADLDLELAIDMLSLTERCDRYVLASGDGDFAPLVDAVGARGVRVAVLSTQNYEAHQRASYRASDLLLDAADEFIPIESIAEHIRRKAPRFEPPRFEPAKIIEPRPEGPKPDEPPEVGP